MNRDESMSVDEAAELADQITAVTWLRSRQTLWCDRCLAPSIVLVVRRLVVIDQDGAQVSESRAYFCTDHNEFVGSRNA